jgi:methyltransferase
MTAAALLLGAVTLQRLAELVLARRNTTKLLTRGAQELGAVHYPLIVALHGAWLGSLWVFGYAQPINMLALACYLLLEVLRGWVMWTLGARWTTRILVVPGEPLVARGPYRYFRHPNYAVVAGEIALLPLTLGLPSLAVIFTALNAAVLTLRIRTENRALPGASASAVGST